MSQTLSQQFSRLLQELHIQCNEIRGTVVATAEGFLLAASGELDNDMAAATAVHISQVVDQHLSLLQPASSRDQLIWTDSGVWYITRLADEYILMAVAEIHCTPGMLRLVSRNIDGAVRRMLAQAQQEVDRLSSLNEPN